MPYCEVSKYREDKVNGGVNIFYEQYGEGDIKVLLIIGLAGTHDSWGPQIKWLTGVDILNKEDACHTKDIDEKEYSNGSIISDSPKMQELLVHNAKKVPLRNSIQVCSFDNRGVGRSSVPKHRPSYTTTIMARDALALLDHLGWKKAHVFGHSMGAMVACKLAAIEPNRISSLALLNATGGGFECFPKIDRTMISIILRFLKARTPEERADVDLDTHYTKRLAAIFGKGLKIIFIPNKSRKLDIESDFSFIYLGHWRFRKREKKEFLESYVGNVKRRAILYQEYVRNISTSGMQSKHGFDGHVNACWTHKITPKEYKIIRTAGFLVAVIHGRHDIIAQVRHGRQIAKKLHPVARMIEFHGGHLVSHEKTEEVNQALMELIEASKSNMKPLEWGMLSQLETGLKINDAPLQHQGDNEDDYHFYTFFYNIWGHLQMILFYFLGLFHILWTYVKQFSVCFKKEKVERFHTPIEDHDRESTRIEHPSALVPQC